MAIATFHSLRGTKSALIMVKANPFVFSGSPCYVPKESLPEGTSVGDSFTIPDGYTLVDMVDGETGEVRTTETGVPLKILSY